MAHRLPQEEFDYIYSKVPRVTVEVLIKSGEGLLLAKRDIEPCIGMWHIPGGTILLGETVADTAKRIAKQETGIDIEIEKLIGVIEYPVFENYGQPVGIALLCNPVGGSPKGSDEGYKVKYFKWIPENTIPEQADFLNKMGVLKNRSITTNP